MQKSKKGGNLTNELSKLTIPFGLVLAQKSLESYLNKKKTEPTKKNTPKQTPKQTPKKPPKTTYKGKNQQVSSMRKKTLVASM